MQPVACTPVLSTTVSYLTDRSDVATSMIQFCILNPGRISDFYNHILISFRNIASKYGDSRDTICDALKHHFYQSLSSYFPEDSITTNFTTEDYDPDDPDDHRYRVIFDIYFTLPDGTLQPAVLSGYFNVEKDSSITVSFL